jgi:hypothetical protein
MSYFRCSQTSSTLSHYALGSEDLAFTFESLSKWLFSHSSASYSKKSAKLAALNNMSATAALSSQSVLVIGTVKNLCESSPCDRRLVKLAEKFETSVRQLLEHNHRHNMQSIYFMLLVFSVLILQACACCMAAS